MPNMGEDNKALRVNFRSLKDVVVAADHVAPAIITAVTPSLPAGHQSADGPMNNPPKVHRYVRLESLPKELADRVMTALEMLSWG